MDSSERGMNPVPMTIINPRKEYRPGRGSNQWPPVLKSTMLPTDLWGLAGRKWTTCISLKWNSLPRTSSIYTNFNIRRWSMTLYLSEQIFEMARLPMMENDHANLCWNLSVNVGVMLWTGLDGNLCGKMSCGWTNNAKTSPLPIRVGGFNHFPNKPWFLCVCSTSLMKTLRGKEKLLIMINFSFSHSVFYPFGKLSAILTKVKIVVCKLLQFGWV